MQTESEESRLAEGMDADDSETLPVLKSNPIVDGEFKDPNICISKSSTEDSQTINNLDVSSSCLLDIPGWLQICPEDATDQLQVLKSGQILEGENIDLSYRSLIIFGRQPRISIRREDFQDHYEFCVLRHPSISRVHAYLIYGRGPGEGNKIGWYLVDLNSTHGTIVNKHKMLPNKPIRIRPGYIIKFGSSSRLHIFDGLEEEDENADIGTTNKDEQLTWTQQKEQHYQMLAEKAAIKEAVRTMPKTNGNDNATDRPATSVSLGCSWGLADDDCQDGGDTGTADGAVISSFSYKFNDNEDTTCLSHEKIYIDDPKKYLTSFFEREGLENPDYKIYEGAHGNNICSLLIPLDSQSLRVEYEIPVGQRNKEGVVACALKACRLLDKLGELDPGKDKAEIRRLRKIADLQENDYYSSDEDVFLDRTGAIEKRRKRRMKNLGVIKNENDQAKSIDDDTLVACESNMDILARLEEIGKKILDVSDKIHAANEAIKPKTDKPSELDDLESYMSAIKSGAPNREQRLALKAELFRLRQEETRLLVKAKLPTNHRVKTTTPNAPLKTEESFAAKCVKSAKNAVINRKITVAQQKNTEKSTKANIVDDNKPTKFIPEEDEDDENKQQANQISKEPEPDEVKVIPPHDPQPRPETSSSVAPVELVNKNYRPMTIPDNLKKTTRMAVNPPSRQDNQTTSTLGRDTKFEIRKRKMPTTGEGGEVATTESFVDWIPPEDKSSDGRTHLNDQLGY